jgi:hypothetical protein
MSATFLQPTASVHHDASVLLHISGSPAAIPGHTNNPQHYTPQQAATITSPPVQCKLSASLAHVVGLKLHAGADYYASVLGHVSHIPAAITGQSTSQQHTTARTTTITDTTVQRQLSPASSAHVVGFKVHASAMQQVQHTGTPLKMISSDICLTSYHDVHDAPQLCLPFCHSISPPSSQTPCTRLHSHHQNDSINQNSFSLTRTRGGSQSARQCRAPGPARQAHH